MGSLIGSALSGGLGNAETAGAKAREQFKGNLASEQEVKDAFDLSQATKNVTDVTDPETRRSLDRSKFATEANQQLITDLQKQAAGEGPSLAEAQLKSAQDRNLSQQLAAAASMRGGNQAASQRQLAMQAAQAGQATAQDAAAARIQEANLARQQLATQLGQEQALADNLIQNYTKLGFSAREAEKRAQQDMVRYKLAATQGMEGVANSAREAQHGRNTQAAASAVEEAQQMGQMAMMAFSDKEMKKDIKGADKDIKSFMDALSEYSYKYKKDDMPGTFKGTNFGILAQDLEKSKAGKQMVEDTPEGKMVNFAKGFGTVLASQANLNKRLKELESKKKKA